MGSARSRHVDAEEQLLAAISRLCSETTARASALELENADRDGSDGINTVSLIIGAAAMQVAAIARQSETPVTELLEALNRMAMKFYDSTRRRGPR